MDFLSLLLAYVIALRTKFRQMAEVTNYDFLCPAWKIAIGLLTASALAAGSTSCSSLFRQLYRNLE